eukprot:5136824-Pleurochrysis_carterae.AAC.2
MQQPEDMHLEHTRAGQRLLRRWARVRLTCHAAIGCEGTAWTLAVACSCRWRSCRKPQQLTLSFHYHLKGAFRCMQARHTNVWLSLSALPG